jgi:hypothetical protein
MSVAIGSQIKKFSLDHNNWVPILTPLNCSYYMIIGNSDGSAMSRCSDSDDPSTCYTIPAGGWFSYSVPAFYKKWRFMQGDVVTILKATVPGTVVIIEFYN